jgi:hypothetical protein
MKKYLLFFLVFGLTVMVVGIYNSLSMMANAIAAKAGVDHLHTWICGLAPLFGGGGLSIFVLAVLQKSVEGKCPRCGNEYFVYFRGNPCLACKNNIQCGECGKIIQVPTP